MKLNIPFERVHWVNTIFLITTFVLAVTVAPIYLWKVAPSWTAMDYLFYVGLYFLFYIATGMSITLGYHRLFSHLAFKAKWPVKLFTLLFGSAAFENSVLDWCSDHRRHHKHVDHDEDPYNINLGFFHAHIGWLFFRVKPKAPLDNVKDLLADPLCAWQHKYNVPISIVVSFLFPMALGYWYDGGAGVLGAFLVICILRIVSVQHSTFFINSLCHWIGNRPYSSICSARDSWIMALFTFGEGYHNYHHEFQHDYRNGVKIWQFDPTKWAIWFMSIFGLTYGLRRVDNSKILVRELQEAQKRMEEELSTAEKNPKFEYPKNVEDTIAYLKVQYDQVGEWRKELQENISSKVEVSQEKLQELRKELDEIVLQVQQLTKANLVYSY